MNVESIRNWRIRDFAPGEGATSGAQSGEGDGWIDGQAPGDIYQALIMAKRLPDPYFGRNEAEVAWVRDREWWWHTSISLPSTGTDESLLLICEGLDTFANVFVDGELVGQADNMFRRWEFDLSNVTPKEQHHLAICFHPSIDFVEGDPLPVWPTFTDRISASRRTLMRKAQFGWGWDWGPDLPTVGISGPIRMERRKVTAVRSVNFTTRAIAGKAAHVEAQVDLHGDGEVVVELFDPDGTLAGSGKRSGSGSVPLTVSDPKLWWTADLGEQPLYTLVTRVADAPEHRQKVGIRTITIDQSPDPEEPGTTFFRFILNGTPIFAKGACWVPASSFVSTVPDEIYTDLLTRAVNANMNMMRVWGGGIYEPDIFYDECDRLGLLVWQDFMFACAPYPEESPFLDNVRAEVVEQVMRLRHHASLAVWCGNNENQAIQFFNDYATGQTNPLVGQVIYDDLIPKLLSSADPETPYWPSSPWGGPSPNSMRGGDVHNWTVWHGTPVVPDTEAVGDFRSDPEGVAYTRYAEDMSRFVSEFGLQGAPDIGTLKRWLLPEDITLGSQGFLDRIKDKADKATAMMIPVTGVPQTIEQFVDFTMLCQAEGLKFGIEHFRRRKPHCSGALIWQHNDCWPCVSWSLIDYDGVAKASYYATTRAFAPVLASFRLDDDAAELWITNDTLEPVHDVVTVTMAVVPGGEDWRRKVEITVPANASQCVWRGPAAASKDRVLTVHSDGGHFPRNRLLLAPVKDLPLDRNAVLKVSQAPSPSGLRYTIEANSYAVAVSLRSSNPNLRFQDNHFDLAAGEVAEIHVQDRTGASIDPDTVEVSCFNSKMPAAQQADSAVCALQD